MSIGRDLNDEFVRMEKSSGIAGTNEVFVAVGGHPFGSLQVAREEWASRSPRALFLARGCEPRGRKSRRRHCGKAIEAPAVLRPDRAIDETASVMGQAASGEDVANMGPPQEAA
jgi:hypothetical protein